MGATKRAVALAERVEFWQNHLTMLGLAHWRIDRVTVADDIPGGEGAAASVQPSHTYDTVTFWFDHDFVKHAGQRAIDEAIIHEWLHVFMRDMDQAVESVEDALSPGVKAQWWDWVNHEREGIIDRLARQLYALSDVD